MNIKHLKLQDDGGGTVDVFPVKITENAPDYLEIERAHGEKYPDLPLKLEETTFCSLVGTLMDKYIDRSLLPKYRIFGMEEDGFEYYDHNLYKYEDVYKMIKELKNLSEVVLREEKSDALMQIIRRTNPRIFGQLLAEKDELEKLFFEHKEVVVDYYVDFCEAIKKVMADAPEYELLDFWGP